MIEVEVQGFDGSTIGEEWKGRGRDMGEHVAKVKLDPTDLESNSGFLKGVSPPSRVGEGC